MASKEFLGLFFMWLCLLSGRALGGRDVPDDQSVDTQNRTISISDVSVKSLAQTVPFSRRHGHGKAGVVDYMYYKEALLLDKSLANLSKSYSEMDATVPLVDNWAILEASEGGYTNAIATLNVYGLPTTKANQLTSASLWFVNGYTDGPENFNTVRAGWHVFPDLYGDTNTHFFTYWAGGGPERKGCYNLLCEGFVVTDKTTKYVPGNFMTPLSTYNGPQYFVTIKIEREISTGNWLLHYGDNPVGYWPMDLFNTLLNDATHIFAGGYVTYAKGEPAPPMGSGHFASEGKDKAASMVVKRWKDAELIPLSGTPNVNRDSCYTFAGDDTYYYGGPAGCMTL